MIADQIYMLCLKNIIILTLVLAVGGCDGFSGSAKTSLAPTPVIQLSNNAIDEDAAISDVVGTLSVSTGGSWTYSITNTAGDMFDLNGADIEVGVTTLDHDMAPTPTIEIQATQGLQTVTATIEMNVRRPLPVLPLAVGARVAAIGDSIIGYNNYGGAAVSTANKAVDSMGYGAIEFALSVDPRFNFDSWYDTSDSLGRNLLGANFSVFGDHLDWPSNQGGIVGRIDEVILHEPDIVILGGGTNTINSNDGANEGTAEYVIKKLDIALTKLRNEGIPVILSTITPRNDWPSGDERYQRLLDANIWIRAQSTRDGVIGIWDSWDVLAPGGVFDATKFMADKIHPEQSGAYVMAVSGGSPLLPLLQSAISAGTTFNTDPTVSNLLTIAQGNMIGTSGTKSGAGASGNVAAGYLLNSGTSTAAVGSKEIISGALERQVITVTPSAGSSYETVVLQTPNVFQTTTGIWVQHMVYVETDSVSAIGSIRLQSQIAQVSTIQAQSISGFVYSASFMYPRPTNLAYWLISKPIYIPPGTTYDRLKSTISVYYSKGAPTFTVKFSRPIWRTIVDPKIAWNY